MMELTEQNILSVMNKNEWVDLYAITARMGYHPQSRYFGMITRKINPMVRAGKIECKNGNLKTPFYRLVNPVIP